MSRLDSLGSLLIRIQAKIETRSRRPWYDLQRTYYFDHTKKSINSIKELQIALEHFHVLISDAELAQLYSSFPLFDGDGTVIGFNFRDFAERCYPREKPQGRIVDGRTVSTDSSPTVTMQQQPQSQSQSKQFSPNASFNQQQQQPQQSFQQSASFGNVYGQSLSPQPQQSQPQSQSQSFNGSGSSSQLPIYYDSRAPPAALPYGSTLAATAASSSFSPTNGGTTINRRSRSRSPTKARLTYNRPLVGRFTETPFAESDAATFPQITPYPTQEIKSTTKPRFESKPLNVPQVDVNRRHNISRQYNRVDGAKPTVAKK